MISPESPIGVFDSGIGGLTVVRRLIERLPYENVVYFGDTARVPYGNKSAEVIREYAIEDSKFLISKGVKLIVIACNTASALAMDVVSARSPVPTIGVIEPTATEAVKASHLKSIGVIGTLSTIGSSAYCNAVRAVDRKATIISQACPLFVPLAEEGMFEHHVTNLVAQEYLDHFTGKVDVLILGCTHYPLLRNTISGVLGESVELIDAGEATAKAVLELLSFSGNLNPQKSKPRYEFYVSDFPQKFNEIAERFLGRKLEFVRKVQIYSNGEIR